MSESMWVHRYQEHIPEWQKLAATQWAEVFDGTTFSVRLYHKRGWAEGRWTDMGTAAKLATKVLTGLVSDQPFRVEHPEFVSWSWRSEEP